MLDAVTIVAMVMVLLLLIGLLVPVTERLRVPLTVALSVVGLILGVPAAMPGGWHGMSVGPDAADWLVAGLDIGSSAYLAILLPPLLFEMALAVDVRRLLDELTAVVVLAVLAVLMAIAIVAAPLTFLTDQTLIICVLVGAIVSTTDSAAVVAIFRDLGAPARLQVLIEGESLFNDAAAIAVFAVVLEVLTRHTDPSWAEGGFILLHGLVGGLALGLVLAGLAGLIMPLLGGDARAEATLTVVLAYGSYLIGEEVFGVSGVIAVVVAGLSHGHGGRLRGAAENWASLDAIWAQLGFWANALIFLFAAMLVPRMISAATPGDLVAILVVAVAALVARAVVLYGLMPVVSLLGMAGRLSEPQRRVMLWGGVRGAVTLLLALAAVDGTVLDWEESRFVAVVSCGFTLFTLLVQATTLRPLVRALGLDRLAPADLAIRDRVVLQSAKSVRRNLSELAVRYDLTADSAAIAGEMAAPGRLDLQGGDWTPVMDRPTQKSRALTMLAKYEERLYLSYFQRRLIGRRLVRVMTGHAGRLADGAKGRGEKGYSEAAASMIEIGPQLKFALALHRRLRIVRPLRWWLTEHSEVLLTARMAALEIHHYAQHELEAIFGEVVSRETSDMVAERQARIGERLEAVALQFPSFAQALETRFLARAALRLERLEYERLAAEGIVNPEIQRDLLSDLKERETKLEHRPLIDLGLSRSELLSRLSFFEGLGEDALARIALLLTPHLALPGERIVSRGERGDRMYFISSGAVEVSGIESPVRLGSGDFFGEMALLHPDGLRSADVTALGYCQLLELKGRDFIRLAEIEPELRRQIDAEAARRQGGE